MVRAILSIILSFAILPFVSAQTEKADRRSPPDSSKPNSINISAEFRFRTEYRHGYRTLFPKNSDDTTAAFFNAQRTRLNIGYSNRKIDVYFSLQDVRVWGEQNQRVGRNVPLYLYEGYVEPHFNSDFSVRIGRQKISYDNQRLFSHNDWRNAGSSYDAVRLIYSKSKLSNEFSAAFNQSGENYYNTVYKPSGFVEFKVLAVHYLRWNPSKLFQITTLNAADGYQSSKSKEANTTFMRYTSGGRVEVFKGRWYFTTAGYYQYGTDSSGIKLSAWYLQPEIKFEKGPVSVKAGAEILSGTDVKSQNDHSFVTLYGSAHRFNGNLDLFTSFPKDLDNAGLVNPYLGLAYRVKKWTVNLDNHGFFSQKDSYDANSVKMNRYLGFETDARINYKANDDTNIEFGGAIAFGTESMAVMKYPSNTNPGYYSLKPYFAYFSLQLKPSLLQFKF